MRIALIIVYALSLLSFGLAWYEFPMLGFYCFLLMFICVFCLYELIFNTKITN